MGWLLSDEQVTQLEKLALGSARENVEQHHWRSPVQLDLDLLFDGQLSANINNHYFAADLNALRNKLAQYPSGMKFNVTIFGEQSRLDPVVQNLLDLALERGLTLEISPNH